MANLIITIIGLAIFAIVAIAGMYYGGVAFENAKINATANTIVSEAQQILYAERMWSTNNNQPDISGMGAAGNSGTGMSALVNGKELSEWASFGGTMGVSTSLTNPGPQPSLDLIAATPTTGTYDYGCYNMDGYAGEFIRAIFAYGSQNYLFYLFYMNVPYTAPCTTSAGNFSSSTTDVSQINHPIVRIAKAINANINQISPSADLSRMPYIGLPLSPVGGVYANTLPTFYSSTTRFTIPYLDSNGTIQTNYCFIRQTVQNSILCVFGPS